MKKILFRALWIWTLKTVAYAAFFVASIVFFFNNISPVILAAIYDLMIFLLAFLFAEWIFRRVLPNIRQLIVLIIVTYFWDMILLMAFSIWLLGPYRYSGTFMQGLLLFIIHSAAISLAYYARKRFAAVMGLAEGLEA